MDSSTQAAASAADRRIARRRVGAVAIAAFVALLLLGATRGPAEADPAVPATAPATTQPAQPQQSTPAQPQQTAPLDPDPDHDGFGPRDDRGGDRGGGSPGGGGTAPAPSTGGGVTT